jgi:hypothetical protein
MTLAWRCRFAIVDLVLLLTMFLLAASGTFPFRPLLYLLSTGATLHYATELIGSSFRLQDNPQAKDGGACGCGVSWEAKEGI